MENGKSKAGLAYVLCAGIGRRLRPLTLHYPKALLPVAGRPMVFHVLDALRKHGVRRFLVNLHAHPAILRRALNRYAREHRVRFTFLHEKTILGTGGAIRNAKKYLTEPFWLVNCDFLPFGFSFEAMERTHQRKHAVATLATRPMRPSEPFNSVGVGRNGKLVRVSKVFGKGGRDHVFLGVHRLEPSVADFLPDRKIFPIFSGMYRPLHSAGLPVYVHSSRPRYAFDLGTLAGYFSANFSPGG